MFPLPVARHTEAPLEGEMVNVSTFLGAEFSFEIFGSEFLNAVHGNFLNPASHYLYNK